jgi:hypothetical protein
VYMSQSSSGRFANCEQEVLLETLWWAETRCIREVKKRTRERKERGECCWKHVGVGKRKRGKELEIQGHAIILTKRHGGVAPGSRHAVFVRRCKCLDRNPSILVLD